MKKYLFAALVFIAGFIAFVFIHVLAGLRIGGIFSYVLIGIWFSAVGWVYKKFRDKENLKNYGSTEITGMPKDDVKNFTKFFGAMDYAQEGIEEVIVSEGKDGTSDFIIGIRTLPGRQVDYEAMRAQLHKIYYKHIKFVFVNLNAMGEGSEQLFVDGQKFHGRE